MATLTEQQQDRRSRLIELRRAGTISDRQRNALRRLNRIRRGEQEQGPSGVNTPQIDKGADRAEALLEAGQELANTIVPTLAPGGEGLDRLDFDQLNSFLTPAVSDVQNLRADTAGRFDDLVNLRRERLGGLDTAENQALRDSVFRDLTRQRAGALRDVARTPGLGAGASFAQRRAINRDFSDASNRANQAILLENVNQRRQALNDLEATQTARQNALTGFADRLATLGTGQANLASQVGQFNAGQQGREIGGQVGALSTAIGLIGDERDKIAAKNKLDELLAFLQNRDEANFQQVQAIL